MEDNNIAKSLGEVPELVKNTKVLIENDEKKFAVLAEAMQHRMEAVIPDSEVAKVATAAARAAASTRCAPPDLSEINAGITSTLISEMKDIVYAETHKAAHDAIADTKIEHEHIHTTAMGLVKYAEEATKKWIMGLAVACSLLAGVLTFILFDAYGGDTAVSKEYFEILTSKYLTAKEREALHTNSYSVGALPKDYFDNPSLAREKIRRNKEILRQRAAEAKAHKGKWTSAVPIER